MVTGSARECFAEHSRLASALFTPMLLQAEAAIANSHGGGHAGP